MQDEDGSGSISVVHVEIEALVEGTAVSSIPHMAGVITFLTFITHDCLVLIIIY